MTTARPEKYASLGTLNSNASLTSGPFRVRDFMDKQSGVLSLIADGVTAGAGTVTLELFVDEAGTLGGTTDITATSAENYMFTSIICDPDLWFTLTMSGRDTDVVTYYAVRGG